jgi:plasmid stabilization system protein ParE
MKGLAVFFTALAEEDLDQIEDYISAHDPAAAARVRAIIVQQSLQLGKRQRKEWL